LRSRNTEQAPLEQAYHCALRLLTGRDYTALKLGQKLRAREFSEEDVEAVVMRLTAEGWLDDRRFAERFAESAVGNGRFFGPRLRLEMRRRGVPAELVAEVVGRMQVEHDEGEEMRSVLERRYPGFAFADAPDREKRRVIAFLQRRGFSVGSIRDAMRY
jgi:regulatory protein